MRILRAAILAAILPVAALAHGGGRDIKGTIESFDARKIVIACVDAPNETVPLTTSTMYRVGKEAGAWRDLRTGSRVIVHVGRDGNAIAVHLPARN